MSPHDIADELDALFAAPVPVCLRGEWLDVRGVWMCELAELLRLTGGAEGSTDGDIEAGWQGPMLDLLGRLCGRDPDWLASLAEDEAERLFAAAEEANGALWRDATSRARYAAGDNRPVSWATAVARLVEAGHRLDDVARYTPAQVDVLLQGHARLRAEQRIDELSIARAAQATDKGFRGAMDALKRARRELD